MNPLKKSRGINSGLNARNHDGTRNRAASSIEIGGGQVPIEADVKASECLGALEASIVALTEKEARSVDGIVAKMEVFAISLLFQDCMEGLRLLAASLFDDLDRLIEAYRPDTRTSFCKGVSDRRTVVGKDFLAVAKR